MAIWLLQNETVIKNMKNIEYDSAKFKFHFTARDGMCGALSPYTHEIFS
jgi:hypothetical protein